jgi:hypothetical protein
MRACNNCERDISHLPLQSRYCARDENPACYRERQNERQRRSRAKRPAYPRENLWDPVAQRSIPAHHKRVTMELDDGGERGRWDRGAWESASERRKAKREHAAAITKLTEDIGCAACASVFMEFGVRQSCVEHRPARNIEADKLAEIVLPPAPPLVEETMELAA